MVFAADYTHHAALCNDLGLPAEEYDVERRRQVGNFPQASSHLTLIGAAHAIAAPRRTRRNRMAGPWPNTQR